MNGDEWSRWLPLQGLFYCSYTLPGTGMWEQNQWTESSVTKLYRYVSLRSFKWVYGNPGAFLVGIRRIPAYHVDYTTEERRFPWIPLEESLVSSAGYQTISKAHYMSMEMALISCLELRISIHCWESRSSISRVEWPDLNPNWWPEIRPLEKNFCYWQFDHFQPQLYLPQWCNLRDTQVYAVYPLRKLQDFLYPLKTAQGYVTI